MNILIPDSWLREYLETDATPKDIQRCLSLCGPSIERLRVTDTDAVYDIEVTTNRVDCMSVYGIAREAAAILPEFGFSAKLLSDPFAVKPLAHAPTVEYLKVALDKQLCPYFAAVLIRDITATSSPDWLVRKLEAVEMRSINPVVDISNLLMHELGQPVHMFDYDKLTKESLKLRESKAGETVALLDGSTRELPGHDIVMEDGAGRLVDLCGLMGGSLSEVDSTTKNVLVFVQTYEPAHIRRTSMATGVRTQAAVLFEKGLPSNSVLPTLTKAVHLVQTLVGGTCASQAIVIDNAPEVAPVLVLPEPASQFASSRLGVELKPVQVVSMLHKLGIKIEKDTRVTVPWWRQSDITLPEDVVEELARMYGYHNIPNTLMSGELPVSRPLDSQFTWELRLKTLLKHLGFTETYTYSLVSHELAAPNTLKLKNPLTAEWEYLRPSLIPSHAKIIAENAGRVPELNFFEIANVYIPQAKALPKEELRLILSTTRKDLSYLKGRVEALESELGVSLPFVPEVHADFVCFEIPLENSITHATRVRRFTPISRFSPIIEDLNVRYAGNYQHLVDKIKKLSDLVTRVDFVDLYENKLTVRLTFHSDDRQLSSADIAPIRHELESLS